MVSKKLKVMVPGKGEITLSPNDHLATGGEGSVYLKGGLIYKIFLDPQRAQASGMADKIQLLSHIRHPFIVAPIDVLLDVQHQVVGYYMAHANGVSLMKTFTNGWRDLNAFTDNQAEKLVENMREAVTVAHDLNAVMVDGNETNYLVSGVEPRIIDVDSWQIGRHKATAIMPSIRDYHTKGHDENSDWFSWGVVSFQVFTGIHPYKGTHADFKKGDMEGRMRANASVFDSRVRLNSAVRDFSCIPAPLLNWYEAVFSHGARSAPPSLRLSQAPAKLTKKVRVRQTASGNVRHERVLGLGGAIRHVSANGIAFYTQQQELKAFDLYRKQEIANLTHCEIELLFHNRAVLVRHAASFVYIAQQVDALHGRIVTGARDPMPLQTKTNILPLSTPKLVVMGNRVFALNPLADNGLVELEVTAMGFRSALTINTAWPVNVNSTQFFDGFGVMDCLGVPFLVIPEKAQLTIVRASVLSQYKLISGFCRSRAYVWLYGVSRVDGKIYRIELCVNSSGKEFDVLSTSVTDDSEFNIAVSPKGIAVGIFEDGIVTVQNTFGTSGKQVADPSVTRDMTLFALPDGIYYYLGPDIFKLSLV